MEHICVELEKIELSFLEEKIFSIPRLAIHSFDRIGIVGKNGSGKSSLLKLIAGELQPNQGVVKRLIDLAYFDQLHSPENQHADGALMSELSIPKIGTAYFSGGEQTKLKIAQLFSHYHEGMLMDEPTTHLDERGKAWLVERLKYYYGALVIVSHDRYILDQLVNTIWEIDDGKVKEYSGNYTDYMKQKQLAIRQQQEKHEAYIKEKARLERAAEEKIQKAKKVSGPSKRVSKKEVKASANRMFMTKSKGTSQKGIERAAKALEQRVEQLEKIEAPKNAHKIKFRQPESLQLHNKFPVMAEEITIKVGEKILLEKASFQFPLGRTIAITGDNGVGKTTLLQYIVKQAEGITISPKVVFGMYEQMDYQFTENETVLAYMKENSDYAEEKIRSVLQLMDFSATELTKNVSDLSGGEAVRLVLSQLFLGRCNILILDEPTNFLDIYTMDALEKLIKAYEGTILLVSHDKTFVDHVAEDVYVIQDRKITLAKTTRD